MAWIAEGHKIALDERLRTLEDCPSQRFSGRGIVICAGGAALFTNAYVLVHVLRNQLHCRLPIEIWHYAAELSPRMISLLRALDVMTIDATDALTKEPAAISNGWQLKSYALMWSRFAEVLLLDADQVPARDPVDVFDWPVYRETGAVLWPDVVDLIAENPVWKACGLAPRTVPSIESGQLLIDKTRHWSALQLTLHLNERADYYYHLIYGDKDTWLLGLLLAQSRYAMIPARPACDAGLCLYQHDFDNAILFQHRTGAKWRYAGTPQELQGFLGAEACAEALRDLRRRWNGLIFRPPPRDVDALRVERDLSRHGTFVFVVLGRPPLRLELLPDSEIGIGRAADRMNWYCESAAGTVGLVLCDAYGPTWCLAQQTNGRWYGHSIADTDVEAYLDAAFIGGEAVSHEPNGASRLMWPISGRYSSFDDVTA